jgi:hypothetical protein
MKWYCKIVPVLCLPVAATLCGCSNKEGYESTEPPSAERIAQTNEVRRKLGLREIKDNWTFEGRKLVKELRLRETKDDPTFTGVERWKDNKGDGCKSIKYDDKYEEIVWEIDYYYSGRSFQKAPNDDGPCKEFLALSYNYRTRHYSVFVASDDEEILSMVDEWKDVPQSAEWNMEERNAETLRVIEKILRMWGVQRL